MLPLIRKTRRSRKSVEALKVKLKDLRALLCRLSRYSRNKNIKIRRVAECENRDTFAVVSKIGETIKEPIAKLDVKDCHCIPARNSDNGNIFEQFKYREKQNRMLTKAKKVRL